MSTPLRDLVTLKPVNPAGRQVRLHLAGDDAPGGGVGGWEVVARPRRRSTAEWVGVEPWTMTLPLITSGVDVRGPGRHVSVEPKIKDLVNLASPTRSTGEPPILLVAGPLRLPAPKMRWVITGLEWGTQMRRNRGDRIQQEVTVHLLEYVRGDVLRGPAAKARARKGL